jgi:hypothetical protein
VLEGVRVCCCCCELRRELGEVPEARGVRERERDEGENRRGKKRMEKKMTEPFFLSLCNKASPLSLAVAARPSLSSALSSLLYAAALPAASSRTSTSIQRSSIGISRRRLDGNVLGSGCGIIASASKKQMHRRSLLLLPPSLLVLVVVACPT